MRQAMFGAMAAIVLMAAAWNWTASANDAPQGYEYCEIMGIQGLGGKVKIEADFGTVGVWADKTVRDAETGKAEKYLSMVDAMNSMAADGGWELHDAYLVTIGTQNVYHYVLKRPRK